MPDIFDEVEQDLRAERAEQLARRYWKHAVLVLVLAVLVAGGYELWGSRRHARAEETAVHFLAGMQAAGTADQPLTPARFQTASAEFAAAARGPGGYAVLARLQLAGLKARRGDLAGAVKAWDDLGSDQEAPRLLRSLATLLSVQHQLGAAPPAQLTPRIAPLVAPDDPWHGMAAETEGLLDLEAGKPELARATFQRLVQDVTASQGVRSRSQALMQALDETAPAAVQSPAQSPAQGPTPAPSPTPAPAAGPRR